MSRSLAIRRNQVRPRTPWPWRTRSASNNYTAISAGPATAGSTNWRRRKRGSDRRRRQNPLLRRILLLFRSQRRVPISALNLQGILAAGGGAETPLRRNPLFLPLLPANPAGGSGDVSKILPALGVCALLHRLDLLFYWLKSGGEHGSGQLGYVLAIADRGFDPFLDQPLL